MHGATGAPVLRSDVVVCRGEVQLYVSNHGAERNARVTTQPPSGATV